MDAKTLDAKTQIRAWKDPKFRASLTAATDWKAHPAGERLVEVDEAELAGVWGGDSPILPSEGWVCSLSGECRAYRESCWAI